MNHGVKLDQGYAMECTRLLKAGILASLLSAAVPNPVFAQNSATERELLEEIKSLRKDIQKLSVVLSTPTASLPAITPAGSSKFHGIPVEYVTLPFMPEWVSGDPQQKFVVVEFADLQCPFCSYFDNNIEPSFKVSHIENGKIQFRAVDFPLSSHPNALKMALINVCAGRQGKYWEMKTLLMANGAPGDQKTLDDATSKLGLDAKKLKACVESSQEDAVMKRRTEQSRDVGVQGTPSFLVGRIEGNSIRGKLIVGASSISEFTSQVDAIITSLNKEP